MVKVIIIILMLAAGCNTENDAKKELWIYTSMYKDTINDLTPLLKKKFPGIKFNWYQAGSEDIATKVNAELLAGNLQADILISSDRFWYEEMAQKGFLHSYPSSNASKVPAQLKNKDGFYSAVSLPVMVLCYNNEVITEGNIPTTFKEMALPKWKDKFTTGSPLASGTNFTTMAMLQHHYGWDYFKSLKTNNIISQGGNSSVLRRIQSKERPVGWVLLENILRFKGKDDRLKIIYPKDGVVTHANVMAVTKKGDGDRKLAEKFVDWMFSTEGQNIMVKSFMYSPLPSFVPPVGAPKFSEILKNSFPWTNKFLQKVTASRAELKEKYTEIMFQ